MIASLRSKKQSPGEEAKGTVGGSGVGSEGMIMKKIGTTIIGGGGVGQIIGGGLWVCGRRAKDHPGDPW